MSTNEALRRFWDQLERSEKSNVLHKIKFVQIHEHTHRNTVHVILVKLKQNNFLSQMNLIL